MSEILVLKDVLENQNANRMDEFVYEPKLISESVYEFNRIWHDHWNKEFHKRFSNNEMYKRLKEIESANEEFSKGIKIVLKANDAFFNENVKLGETIEDLKRQNLLLQETIKDLKQKIGTKPKGFLDMSARVFTATVVARDLQKENERLKESQSQTAPISEDVIQKVLQLKVKGYKNTDISEKTGVSPATVSRYCNKHRGEIEKMKACH